MLDFMCIGAQKCGTTWLYENLRQHPECAFPGGKEVHFWDDVWPKTRQSDHYQAMFSTSADHLRFGDITPSYALLAEATIAEIARIYPSLRLIYMVRDPVERAWSAALMGLSRCRMQAHEASDQWFIDHFHSAISKAKSDYRSTVMRWRQYFADKQLLIVPYERIAHEPELLLQTIAKHIGIDADWFIKTQPATMHQRIFAGDGTPLRDSLKPVLRQLYAEEWQAFQRDFMVGA